MTSPEQTDEPREVWLSGTEHIHLVQDLLGPTGNCHPMGRGMGKSTRMAVDYVQLLLKIPDQKIVITDHWGNFESHLRLAKLVTELLAVLNVDYDIQQSVSLKQDEKVVWIRVHPRILPIS